MDRAYIVFFSFIFLLLAGTSIGRYGGCDVGFAAIDWARGIPTTCDFTRMKPR